MTINEFKDRAEKAVNHFGEVLKSIRTGRANPSLIENIPVDAYGSKMPMYQVASISAPDPKFLSVSVWDKELVDAVIAALKTSEIGGNPSVDGSLIKINLPPMTEERRVEMTKIVGKYEEESKIGIRNLRHEFLDELKKAEKEQKLPESFVKTEEENIDRETKKINEEIEKISAEKKKELMEF
jgi:ribosome recycling factor